MAVWPSLGASIGARRAGPTRTCLAPGQPNWLDTGGLEEGVMFWRFMLTTEPITALETERVSLAER